MLEFSILRECSEVWCSVYFVFQRAMLKSMAIKGNMQGRRFYMNLSGNLCTDVDQKQNHLQTLQPQVNLRGFLPLKRGFLPSIKNFKQTAWAKG